MYRCRWFVLCENVVLDGRSNNFTMVNALSVIRTPEFPSLYIRFSFAAILDRDGEPQGPLSLRFVREKDNENEVLLTAEGDAQAPPTVQFYMNFPLGIRLFKEESIVFRVEAKEGDSEWYTAGTQRLKVELVKKPEAPTDPE